MAFKYRNKTEQDFVIPNIGLIKAGGEIASEIKLENQNLEEIASDDTNTNQVSNEIRDDNTEGEAE